MQPTIGSQQRFSSGTGFTNLKDGLNAKMNTKDKLKNKQTHSWYS